MHPRALLLLASTCSLVFSQACESRPDASPPLDATQSGLGWKGAGLSGAGQSIAAGVDTVMCGDGVPPAGTLGPARGARSQLRCFFDRYDNPAATLEWIVETAKDAELVHVRLILNPDFVDNTYGANAIGWSHGNAAPARLPAGAMGMGAPGAKVMMPMPHGMLGHTFMDLVGSDHAEFKLSDADAHLVLHVKADYLSPASAPSGYASLGVRGGDGRMLEGDAAAIVAVSTSLDRNLNECGMPSYTVDSPATDANYTPNRATPNWDYRVVYDVWVRADAFGASGFGDALVDFVHASPSKGDSPTANVVAGPCPPHWPRYCNNPAGCKTTCVPGPDIYCRSGGEPPPPPAAGSGEPSAPPL
jgi:hypothetical protein